MADLTQFKYRAFLSYSHRDKAWGKWLHGALEGYRIDKDLVGRETPAGPVPKTLRPIFRDREDFSAGHSLTEQTIAALEASQFLIVLCSPNAAKSQYVNQEIRRFKVLGRADRVIPVIVGGEPNDPERECFPWALRFKLGPAGVSTGEHEEPIAADARKEGDGKQIAKQKLVAGLLGVGLDEIARRAERARKQRSRILAGLAGIFLLLTVAATGSAILYVRKAIESEDYLNQTIALADNVVSEFTSLSDQVPVPVGMKLGPLKLVEAALDRLIAKGVDTPKVRYARARMLMTFADSYGVLGQTDKQHERRLEAHRLMQTLVNEAPENGAWQNALSITYEAIGMVLTQQGDLDKALESYNASLAIVGRLIADDPKKADWQRRLSTLYARVGDVSEAQGKLDEAMVSYLSGSDIIFRLAESDPANYRMWLSDQAKNEERIGSVLVARGKFDEALTFYRSMLKMFQLLTDADPKNAEWSMHLSIAHARIGGVLAVMGKFDEALVRYRAGLAISKLLVDSDPTNTWWQSDLAGAHTRVADVLKDLAGC